MKNTAEYTVIAAYSGAAEGAKAISTLDNIPGYLHIHAVRKDVLNSIPPLAAIPARKAEADSKLIHQWGAAMDKELAIRAPITAIGDVLQYGNIGLGSAAMGTSEELCGFVGGGEVFIVPSYDGEIRAFRITKGQGVFPMTLEDKCWTCEIASSDGAVVLAMDTTKTIASRAELLEFLRNAHGADKDAPFIAQFDAYFDRDSFAIRSNGLFPHDAIEKRQTTLFSFDGSDPVGGHLLGDSTSEGDQISKHRGIAPINEAAVVLRPSQGLLQITPVLGRKIALPSNPHEFRQPLLQADLARELQTSDDHAAILINGGGIAGVMTALKLAKIGLPCTITEKQKDFLRETSGSTPGRVGHGFHYRDLETAKLYLASSITFIKENCSNPKSRARLLVSGIDAERPEQDYGLYFIHKNSQVAKPQLLEIYEGIREEYRRLVELDPANKVFGEVEDFFCELDLRDFAEVVDISKMAGVIRTKETLLNWGEFSAHLLEQVKSFEERGLITVKRASEVMHLGYDERGFAAEIRSAEEAKCDGENFLSASHVVNATWTNIEKLDSDLFADVASEERTNRLKLIASLRLDSSARNLPSMFTAMGDFAMFSNEGNGAGKATFAPVTNMIDYVINQFKSGAPDAQLQKIFQRWIDDGELVLEQFSNPESWRQIELELDSQPLYKRLVSKGLNEEEQRFFGEKIRAGLVELYPALAGCEVASVGAGIVKSKGEANIRDPQSAVHKRDDKGLRHRQIGFTDFNGMKLFYGESQSRCVARQIVSDIASDILIERELAKPATEVEAANAAQLQRQKEVAMTSYVRRYATQSGLLHGDFDDTMKSTPPLALATRETVFSAQQMSEYFLNAYLTQPNWARRLLAPQLEFVTKICDAISAINSKTICDHLVQDQQERLNQSLRDSNLFTIFSVITRDGDIVIDGKLGAVTKEMREEREIPNLLTRDYVQKMLHDNSVKRGVVCGSPVVGSTSHEFMIPAGVKLNDELFLTFGMPVNSLIKTLALAPAERSAGFGEFGRSF